MKPGPVPEPTHLKLVKGTVTAADLESEPQPSTQPVTVPDWLSVKAKAVWRRLAPDLIRQGVLTHWDRDMFARFCALEPINREAFEEMMRHGVLVDGAKGRVKNPAAQVLRDTETQLLQLAARFGLTPSDRSRVKLEEPRDDRTGADRLLNS